jgi:formylglycine-generating enzyme required for sulfatase activity
MRLFISYARVDKPYCIQIIGTLDVHEIWYDQRLQAGQNWWQEILRRLDWCEGFVYILSADSIASEYCQKEYQLAQDLGRHVFPVLIDPKLKIPEKMEGMQYADFTKGVTAEAVRTLLNAIYVGEHEKPAQQPAPGMITADSVAQPGLTGMNSFKAISAATRAMENEQYDNAVFLLKQAKANGYTARFIDLDGVLAKAEEGLQRQSYEREAAREYEQIVGLVRLEDTHTLGCEAFQAFQGQFTDYDPKDLAGQCKDVIKEQPVPVVPAATAAPPVIHKTEIPYLDWCKIPAGDAIVSRDHDSGTKKKVTLMDFLISRFPVTNAQYRLFLEDPGGFAHPKWWEFSKEAQKWREENSKPKDPTFVGDERPREMVCWYEAMAFCAWLSDRLDKKITLPQDAQWIRAARGDSNNLYPWGNDFDKTRCNTRPSGIKMTTPVKRYTNGISPFGVYDMCGNVWEWCVDRYTDTKTNATKNLVHGGSFIGPHERAEIGFRYYLDPRSHHSTIGFRLAINAAAL